MYQSIYISIYLYIYLSSDKSRPAQYQLGPKSARPVYKLGQPTQCSGVFIRILENVFLYLLFISTFLILLYIFFYLNLFQNIVCYKSDCMSNLIKINI